MLRLFKRSRKACLVLGGGSARGMAHIGVLKVFEREKIPISAVVGTSMGALIGAAYCLGVPTAKMEEQALKFNVNMLTDLTMPKMGLMAGDKLEAAIRGIIGNGTFKECKIPLHIVTTDIEKGEEIIYGAGDLIKIIRASCSWPGIFNPVKMDGRLLVDGGIKNSVPTKTAKNIDNLDYMIAVDVGFCVKEDKITNIFEMILQSFQIMGHELNSYQANEADMVINVDLDDLNQAAFDRAKEAIVKGELAVESNLKYIKKELRL